MIPAGIAIVVKLRDGITTEGEKLLWIPAELRFIVDRCLEMMLQSSLSAPCSDQIIVLESWNH